MTNEIEHSGVVAVGDVREAIYVEGKDGWRVTSIDILREWFGGERYANDYEYLDANYGKRAQQVVDWLAIAALARPAQEPVAGKPLEWIGNEARSSLGDLYSVQQLSPNVWTTYMNGTAFPGWKAQRSSAMAIAQDNDDRRQRAAPQPVINSTHSQEAGTPGLLTDPAPSDHSRGIEINAAEVKALLYGVPQYEFSAALSKLAAWLMNNSTPKSDDSQYVTVPVKMTADMINAWSGGLTVTTDEIAYRSNFQEAWCRVLAAAPAPALNVLAAVDAKERNAIIEQCAKTGGEAFRKNRAAFPTQEASLGVKAHHIEDAIRALKTKEPK